MPSFQKMSVPHSFFLVDIFSPSFGLTYIWPTWISFHYVSVQLCLHFSKITWILNQLSKELSIFFSFHLPSTYLANSLAMACFYPFFANCLCNNVNLEYMWTSCIKVDCAWYFYFNYHQCSNTTMSTTKCTVE